MTTTMSGARRGPRAVRAVGTVGTVGSVGAGRAAADGGAYARGALDATPADGATQPTAKQRRCDRARTRRAPSPRAGARARARARARRLRRRPSLLLRRPRPPARRPRSARAASGEPRSSATGAHTAGTIHSWRRRRIARARAAREEPLAQPVARPRDAEREVAGLARRRSAHAVVVVVARRGARRRRPRVGDGQLPLRDRLHCARVAAEERARQPDGDDAELREQQRDVHSRPRSARPSPATRARGRRLRGDATARAAVDDG